MSWDAGEVRRRARKMAQSNNIVVESLARLIEQILIEANQYHVERIAKLEAALREIADIKTEEVYFSRAHKIAVAALST